MKTFLEPEHKMIRLFWSVDKDDQVMQCLGVAFTDSEYDENLERLQKAAKANGFFLMVEEYGKLNEIYRSLNVNL